MSETSRHRRGKLQWRHEAPSRSCHLNVRDGGLAGAAILLGIEGNLLTLAETAQAGALQRGGVDENVLAAIVWLDESEAFLIVVELYCAVRHRRILSLAQAHLSWWPRQARPQPVG